MHTEETIAAQKEAKTKDFINKSFVGNVTIYEASSKSFGKAEVISMSFERDNGEKMRFVNFQYKNDSGAIVEDTLAQLRDIVKITGAAFTGANPEAFDGKVIQIAGKVVAKKSGKAAGMPMMFVNGVFDSEGFTVKEKALGTEAKQHAYWTKALENDAEITVGKKSAPSAPATEANNPFAEGTAAQDDSEFPF